MVSKVDKNILELLQQDARMPLTQIAKEVGMSENGVKYRLNKLEDQGVIERYALLIDPKKVGKNVLAIFNIEIEPKSMKKSIPLLTKTDEFIKVYHTTGQYSLTAMGIFDSNDSLTKFINGKLLNEFSIQNYTVNIITKQYKDSFYKI